MRRYMSTLVTVSGWFTILTAAGGQADDPSKKAIAELQGVWKLVTLERDDDVGDVADRSCYWLVKGSKVFYGGDELATLAPDAGTTPRSLDLTFRSPEAQREGIYTVKDGTWKICVNWDAAAVKERPEQFSTKDKPAYRILTFERVKLTEAEAASDGLGYVGIALRKREDTLLVGMVLPDSPANKAGLAQDDQVLQIAGADVGDLLSTVKAFQKARPGSELVVRIKREDKEKDVKIKVGTRPFRFLVD